MNILQLIASNSFIATNKELIKLFGLIEANIIGLFASMANYNNKDGGWFYITYDKIEEELNISKHISSKAIEKLIKSGIIIDKKQGVPCRRFFKFQEEALFNSLKLKNLTTRSEKTELLEVKKLNSLKSSPLTTSSEDISLQAVKELNAYNNKYNNKYNNIISSENLKNKKAFIPPTLEEIKDYCIENNFQTTYEVFYKYYNPDWTDSQEKPVKNWKKKLQVWASNERNYKKMDVQKPNFANKEKTTSQKEIEDLKDRLRFSCHQINKLATQHLNFESLEKVDEGFTIKSLSPKSMDYINILNKNGVKICQKETS